MIRGIGNDIIEIERIKKNIEHHGERFLNRIFTQTEQNYCLKHRESARHFAGRFAAKEAIVKALGTGFRSGITWTDIEICNDESGKPSVNFSEKLLHLFGSLRFLVTISHCQSYATAVAIWEI